MTQNEFISEIKKLGLDVREEMLQKLDRYYEMIIEYNKVMNLTAITEKNDVYLKHFYDSLTICKIIDLHSQENLCDLGSGAGFPGIVIKIFFPKLKVVLVDSLNKRVNFLNRVIQELNLKDIVAIHSRIEEYSKSNIEKFNVVTARAVAPLNILLELGIALVKNNSYFIAMKGNIDNETNYDNALNELSCKVEKMIKFILPIENSKRCLVKIKKMKTTNKKYPRNYNEIKKKSL